MRRYLTFCMEHSVETPWKGVTCHLTMEVWLE